MHSQKTLPTQRTINRTNDLRKNYCEFCRNIKKPDKTLVFAKYESNNKILREK